MLDNSWWRVKQYGIIIIMRYPQVRGRKLFNFNFVLPAFYTGPHHKFNVAKSFRVSAVLKVAML